MLPWDMLTGFSAAHWLFWSTGNSSLGLAMVPRAWAAPTATSGALSAAGAPALILVPVSIASTLVNLSPEYCVRSQIVIKANKIIITLLMVKKPCVPLLTFFNISVSIADIYYGLINYFTVVMSWAPA